MIEEFDSEDRLHEINIRLDKFDWTNLDWTKLDWINVDWTTVERVIEIQKTMELTIIFSAQNEFTWYHQQKHSDFNTWTSSVSPSNPSIVHKVGLHVNDPVLSKKRKVYFLSSNLRD